ncbi:MAG: hypothetical protein 2 [Bactrocera dorsalis negev-like virus isolate Bz]|nr:MAG: hypothetical protein 2 [Bactrocera dorsalis negev-like virus isolate Bz]
MFTEICKFNLFYIFIILSIIQVLQAPVFSVYAQRQHQIRQIPQRFDTIRKNRLQPFSSKPMSDSEIEALKKFVTDEEIASNTEDPDGKISAADRGQFYSFCCSCKDVNANCPICEVSGKVVCPYNDLTGSAAQKLAAVGVELYYKYLDYTEMSVAIGHKPFYKWNKTTYQLEPENALTCKGLNAFIRLGLYSEMEKCTTVTRINGECPRSDIVLDDYCGWSILTEVQLDKEYKACIAPFIRNYNVSYGGYPYFICNVFGTRVHSSLFNDIFSTATKIAAPSSEFIPKPIGRVENKWVFETIGVSRFYNYLKYISGGAYSSDFELPSTKKYWVVKDPTAMEDSRLFNGYPSYLIDRIIMKPQCTAVSFNSDKTFCREATTTSAGYISPVLPLQSHVYTYSVPIDNIDVPEMNFSFPCSRLSDLGTCSLTKVLNEFQHNFTTRINTSLAESMILLTNIMGANDSSLYTFSIGGQETRRVGGWFSGLFADLIEPFFEAFINVVLKAFLPPLMEAFISFLEVVSDLITRFTEDLLKIISSLGYALSNLISSLLNLLLGLICFIETHLLLFEYTVVFLVILFYFIDDWVIASIIVLILMLVFGIVRRSPSFLMYFVSQDFLIFNFSEYYSREFLWDYSISYTDSKVRYVFFFFNSTVLKINLY